MVVFVPVQVLAWFLTANTALFPDARVVHVDLVVGAPGHRVGRYVIGRVAVLSLSGCGTASLLQFPKRNDKMSSQELCSAALVNVSSTGGGIWDGGIQ